MSSAVISRQKLFGLLELDAAGTVLYSRIETDGDAGFTGVPDIKGRNFYSEVVPFRNVEEFHRRLDSFHSGNEQASSFEFNCDYEDGAVPVRVLLARISERSGRNARRSTLVHIKKTT